MTVRFSLAIAGLAAVVAAALPVSAQKKPQPPPHIPGTAWIDHDADTPCGADVNTRISDRLTPHSSLL